MPVRNDSGHPRPVTRSKSILGSLKSLLPSRIFGGDSGAQSNTSTKRRGSVGEVYEVEGGQRSSKRQRVDRSPVREVIRPPQAQRYELAQPQTMAPSGYLEPPSGFFTSKTNHAPPRQSSQARSMSVVPIHRLPSAGIGRGYRSSLAPEPRHFSRTQSMDPPNRYRPMFGTVSRGTPLVRDVSMDDCTFNKEMSASPALQPFRMRTSLTPAPAGMNFGPDPTRRERNESEPPPLAQLIDRPMFVKAPSEAPVSRATPRPPPNTLGALMETQRTAKPTQRSHSSLKLGSDSSMQDLTEGATPTPTSLLMVNQTDHILTAANVFKNPFLPTRLQESKTVPVAFIPKPSHTVTVMNDREKKPRLGTAQKRSASEMSGEENYSAKPYSGRGPAKKIREKRRLEEDDELEKEKADAIETDEELVADTSIETDVQTEELVKELEKPIEFEVQPASSAPSTGKSTLRVGRQTTSRNHIARPRAKARAGRFSALYEEEDEDAMDDGSKSQTPKPKATFAPPPGFSFAKDVTPINFGSAKTKDAPISSLPFSLMGGPSATQVPSKPADKSPTIPVPKAFAMGKDVPHTSPPITVAADSQSVFASAPLTPLINAVPQIALIPPSPGNAAVLATAPKQPVAEQLDASVTGKGSSAVPNFFANSAALSKPSAQVNLPSNFSFGVSTPTPAPAASSAKETPSLFGKPAESKSDAAGPSSVFNLFGAPKATPPVSVPGEAAKNPTEATKAPAASVFKGFSNTEPSAFAKTFPETKPSEPAKVPEPAKETSAPASLFGQPAAKPAAPTPAPASIFNFSAPPTAAERPASTPSPLPFQFGSKPTEPASAPASESRPSTGDALKPPFSFTASSTGTQSSAFGAPQVASTPSTESAKTPFIFGSSSTQPPSTPTRAPSAAPASAPAIAAPKPSFNAFNFGQPAATSTPEPPKSPFMFANPGTAPSTPTPTTENKFTFATPAATPAPASGSMLFGSAVNGAPAPGAGTVTPPKKDDSEIMMDESPVRGLSMTTPNKPDLSKLTGGFGGALSPFGQPAQNGSSGFNFNNPSSPNPFAKSEAKPAEKAATPFSFGQPTTTGGFTFGQKTPETPTASTPSTFAFNPKAAEPNAAPAGGFPFGQKAPETNAAPNNFAFNSPATPSTSSPVFGFAAPPQIAQSNSFGQPASATSSAAPSPNPFSQPAQAGGFFGGTTPTTAPAGAFNFGNSQPASPAAPSAGLPGQNGATGFTFGASTPSPFAPSATLPQTGGPVFNMGAAPPPAAPGMAGRQMKKLPTRRGGKR